MVPMMNWQSMRSVMPPWPGILSPKSLILKVRFRPEAKKPPNGAMSEANVARARMWNWTGLIVYVLEIGRPGGMNGTVYFLGIKTGFGVHSSPVHTFAPRSYNSNGKPKVAQGHGGDDDLR